MKILRSYWSRPGGRYLVIGVGVYIFELAIIWAALALGASNVVAVSLSFWFGLLLSFGLQKVITFGDKRYHRRLLFGQFLAVCALVVWNFGFTLLVTQALQAFLPAVACRTLALGITTIWNFYLYKTRIFGNVPAVID